MNTAPTFVYCDPNVLIATLATSGKALAETEPFRIKDRVQFLYLLFNDDEFKARGDRCFL